MKSIAKKRILGIQPYVPGRPIEEVQRELGLRNVVKLASNENPYGPSPKVLKAVADASKDLNRYPDGDCYYLRQALARKLKVRPQQLIFGNGSDEIIVLAVRAFVQEEDEVVIAKPSFLIYDIASRIEGARLKKVPLKDFRYDLDGMRGAVTPRTKIIFLGNPDNPGGIYIPQSDLLAFLKDIPKNILVFIDEAYFEYVRAKDYGNSIELVESNKNVIVTRTFSKMYGLAGLRVGYGAADADTVEILNRVREPFNVNSLAQAGALACLKDKAYYSAVAGKIESERRFLYQQLTQRGIRFIESFANFVLVDVGQDASAAAKALLKQGVIVRDMNFWGMKNFIRVTIGKPQENKKFLRALEGIL